jgi:hypothetical protein
MTTVETAADKKKSGSLQRMYLPWGPNIFFYLLRKPRPRRVSSCRQRVKGSSRAVAEARICQRQRQGCLEHVHFVPQAGLDQALFHQFLLLWPLGVETGCLGDRLMMYLVLER